MARLRLASVKQFNRLRLRLSNRLHNRSYNRLINREDYTSLHGSVMRRVRNVHNQKSYYHCSLPTVNSRRVQIIEQFPTFRERKVVIWFFTLPRDGVKLKYQETYYELFD